MFSLPRLPWTQRPRKEKLITNPDGEVINFLDSDGYENPDPVPLAPPVGYKPAPSLSDQIREMVRSERLAREAAEAGFETFQEADDFDIPDDPLDPSTPFEAIFETTSVAEMERRRQEASAPPQPSPVPPAPATEPASAGDIKPPPAKPEGV